MESLGTLLEPSFSVYTADTDSDTYIDFGVPDSSIVGDYTKTTWVPIDKSKDYWANDISGWRWGGEEKDLTVKSLSGHSGFLDSGSGYILGPKDAIIDIYDRILELTSSNRDSDNYRHTYPCTDRANFFPFYVNWGGYWIEVRPEDYSISYNDNASRCFTALDWYDSGAKNWYLGAAFMRNWYITHDYDAYRIGFTRLPGSTLPTPKDENEPWPGDPDYDSDDRGDKKKDPDAWDYASVGLGSAFIIGVFAWAIIGSSF